MPRASNAGGARRGGGNKPGRDIDRLRPALPAPGAPLTYEQAEEKVFRKGGGRQPLPPPRTPLHELPLPIQSALRLMARGLTVPQIEHKMVVSEPTLRKWRDLYRYAGTEATQELSDPSATFRPFLEDAVRVNYDIMMRDGARAADRLHAVDTVVDRTFGKVPVQQPTAGLPPIQINIYSRAESRDRDEPVPTTVTVIDANGSQSSESSD